MTAPARQHLTVEEIKDLLHAQRHQVAYAYAPPTQGSYQDGPGYWTLNPGRADRRVGSFVVWLDGPKAGRWNDYASGQHGDLLDLIALNLGCDLKMAFREARSFLGLQADDPADIARRRAAAERARQLRAEAERKGREEAERKRKGAFALWLSAQERIAGTPVEAYLKSRAIDLRQLGVQPRALRYHHALSFSQVDRETGEVFEGKAPAMVALITDVAGKAVAVHRTWLAIGPDGRWGKAPLPKPKMVLGDYKGAAIRLWRGLGPRGGRGAPLAKAEHGTRVYLTEGIEDALSVAMLLPHARIMAAIANTNFANVELPDQVTEVTIVADNDPDPDVRAVTDRAAQVHARKGRTVRIWRDRRGAKDVNDALRRDLAEREKQKSEDGADGLS